MDPAFYFNRLYPFQDQVLQVIASTETGFYLTGGTALSRGYLNHRFSDDLDFFVNDKPEFSLWADRLTTQLNQSERWTMQVLLREDRFVRLNLTQSGVDLKIEMVNDVPSRVGEPWVHPVLKNIDTAENILANKITAALDRSEPKDIADIWGLCYRLNLSLTEAITGVQGKAVGVFPVDLARVLCSVSLSDWQLVRWIQPPEPEVYVAQVNKLGNSLIFPR